MNLTALRHEPIQHRAQTRLECIHTAARQAIAEHGRDEFTTAHVATLARCSIGTIYRYYADRTAILNALYPNRIAGLGDPHPPISDKVWTVSTDDGIAGVFTTEQLADEHAARIGHNTVVEWTWLLGTPDPALAEALTEASSS